MNEIGGFLELELPGGEEYHSGLLSLNTGRNALEYILRARNYKKVYLPYYHCHVLQTPLKRLGIPYSFYPIDYNFEFAPFEIEDNEAILYINFFGLKDEFVRQVTAKYANMIIDNAQSFFSRPLPGVDTIYSCRKFFGVPDGAYLSTNIELKGALPKDLSYDRYRHLVGRTDKSASDFYKEYAALEESLDKEEVKQMSRSTQKVLSAIDYDAVKQIRRENFNTLSAALQSSNRLDLPNDGDFLFYPYLSSAGLRNKLIQSKVYVGTYWTDVIKNTATGSVEYDLATNLVCLPIDQRYSPREMEVIIRIIQND